MSSKITAPFAANRLIHEISPYLLQHAHNPVDWFPWGPEAFEKARQEDKPIFLSVGYSTCYWCHVMERQSFENEAIAAEMNRCFINIKVDREERPDVDSLYMTAVQVLTHQGGWPMSVWLTPDLRPFHGGTYFPPRDAYGRPGFGSLILAIDDAWRNRRQDVELAAEQLSAVLKQVARVHPPQQPVAVSEAFLTEVIEQSASDYEPKFGGFGSAPKFPRQTLLELLLAYLATPGMGQNQPEIQRRLIHTLDAMAAGGIRDHLGGGFHRYSTDNQWLVPHFEIMLYDNAMLALVYAQAAAQFDQPRHAEVARGICDFVLREMTSPQGAFHTAFDAEVDAQEGLSYLWTSQEIDAILGTEDAKLFNKVYGVDRGPNFADPHHGDGVPDKSILYLPDAGLRARYDAAMAPMREKLYAARRQRKQPLLDTKIITSWNALMIRGMARCGRLLREQRYVEAAARAADFLLQQHRRKDGTLWRTSREGVFRCDAFLDDYAFLALALLELHEATQDQKWKTEAERIVKRMRALFADADGGFFFTASGAADLIVRQKISGDSPLPSGNAAAALALLELGHEEEARQAIAAFAGPMAMHGGNMSSMAQAAMELVQKHGEFAVRPDASVQRGAYVPTPEEIARSIVKLEGQWPSPNEFVLHLEIAPGYHLNAHDPKGQVVPTKLVVDDAGAQVERVDYPTTQSRTFAFADSPMEVYEGRTAITVRFSESMEGAEPIRLSLSYQACDESSCLPPVVQHIEAQGP